MTAFSRHLLAFAALLALALPLNWLLFRNPPAPKGHHPLLAWHQGGTLHHAIRAEWEAATEENRLATCADFILAYCRERRLPPPSGEELRRKATALEDYFSRVAIPWRGDAAERALRPLVPKGPVLADLAYRSK